MSHPEIPLAERLKRESHRICSLILNSDLEWIDIDIEINRLRETCALEAPGKLELFEAVYGSRFLRLWEQWRARGAEPEAWEAARQAWEAEWAENDEG